MAARPPMSLKQQAEFIDGLADRCKMLGGRVAAETHMTLEPGDVEDLSALAGRLRRMAPYESEIRKMVTRR